MTSSTPSGTSPVASSSRPENEDDDPVGDNTPVSGDDSMDEPGNNPPSNSGAVRTGNDGDPSTPPAVTKGDAEVPPQIDIDGEEPEAPEGSDVPVASDEAGNDPQPGNATPTTPKANAPGPANNLPKTARG
ncbi:hypothetical protein SAMN05216359_10198 [Roseateles sp. YR242]|uniref:hypothetical protein n=1 Tax=Roseateles sp. YR242 TaxID=1855305 RepID=UPI0008B0330D|nr:hypothetical protein [Roseateles sp. YR242]SEK23029.1 hypothetical protein SAMN05216359_10198 [Roseateles sp. YR242]